MVGWNEFVIIDDQTLLRDESQGGRRNLRNASCVPLGSDGINFNRSPLLMTVPDMPVYDPKRKSLQSKIFAESQIVQEVMDFPSTDIQLVHHSSRAAGRHSILIIKLLPDLQKLVPKNLVRIHITINVAGISERVDLEPEAGVTHVFAWDGKNAYDQKVYGVAKATVLAKYVFTLEREVDGMWCSEDVVISRKSSINLNGFDLSISDIGGWNLPFHHRLVVVICFWTTF